MKTTNLFVDFLVIGFLAAIPVIPFATDYCIAHPPDWKSLAERSALLLPTAAVAVYILGMLFNQAAGYVVKFLSKIRMLPSFENLQEKAFSSLETDYHSALQIVVTKSSDAYVYLSYRRSIIRIFRALLTSMLCLSVSLIVSHTGSRLLLDLKTVITLCSIAIMVFAGVVFTKNLKGYYSAIAIFFRHLSK